MLQATRIDYHDRMMPITSSIVKTQIAEGVAFNARIFAATTISLLTLYKIAGIFWFDSFSAIANHSHGGRRLMDEVERDSSITINVGFGNITFCKDEDGTFAHAIVDLSMKDPDMPAHEDQIEIALKVPASPEIEPISVVVERSRTRIATLLRKAADHFDAETAESLLYPRKTVP